MLKPDICKHDTKVKQNQWNMKCNLNSFPNISEKVPDSQFPTGLLQEITLISNCGVFLHHQYYQDH